MKNLLCNLLEVKNIDDIYDNTKIELLKYKDKRLSYSQIAQFVFENNKEIDCILENLENIKSKADITKDENSTDLIKIIDKIIDHIGLEFCRLKYLEETQKVQIERISSETGKNFEPISKKMDEYESKIKNYEDIIKEHGKEIKNWNANIVTVLGLFSAIVLTFFGGMSGINSIFTNVNSISIYRLIFIVFIIALTIFNVIFMLLYYIGIITDKSLSRNCTIGCVNFSSHNLHRNKNEELTSCQNKNVKCYFKRYPIIMFVNIFFILVISLTGVIYLLNK